MPSTYKVVPFHARIKDTQTSELVAQQLEVAINALSTEGWIYERLETVNVGVNPGCLSTFLGKGPGETQLHFLVFRWPENA